MSERALKIDITGGSLMVPFKATDVEVLKSILVLIKAGWLKPYPTLRESGREACEASEALAGRKPKASFDGGIIKEKIVEDVKKSGSF